MRCWRARARACGPVGRCHFWARAALAAHPLTALGPRGGCWPSTRTRKPSKKQRASTDARFSIRHEGFRHLADLPVGSAGWRADGPGREFAPDRRPPNGVSVSVSMARWTCAWTPRAAKAWPQWLETSAEVGQIAEVIREYGEERFAGPIAKAIVARRQERGPVATTAELADLVAGAVKTREPGQNPATRTFQAFRIFINAELEELQQALEASLSVLQPGGRLVVISFHSLEDRIVKQFIAQHSKEVYDRRAPFAAPQPMRLEALARIKPGAAEVAANPRARSAVMRVAAGPRCRHDAPEPTQSHVLLLAVIASALYLVHTQYESRRLLHRAGPRQRRGAPPGDRARASAGGKARAGHAAAGGAACTCAACRCAPPRRPSRSTWPSVALPTPARIRGAAP
jgi:16S rRNA (cytosine1402-N4)-methyltransferase